MSEFKDMILREIANVKAQLNALEFKIAGAVEIYPVVMDENTPLPIDDIIDLVCEALYIPKAQMLASNRKREVADARHIAYKIAADKHKSENSYKAIARHFNRADHSTVIYAIQTANNLIETDFAFRKKYTACLNTYNKLTKNKTSEYEKSEKTMD